MDEQQETGKPRRGELRIYLGAAPGVGKTYAMLGEAWRRKERGTDWLRRAAQQATLGGLP